MEDYIKEFISKLQRAYESDSMQYNYSVLEIPSKDLTTEVTILLKKARKKWLEDEIARYENKILRYGDAENIQDALYNLLERDSHFYGAARELQDQISRLEAELKALTNNKGHE